MVLQNPNASYIKKQAAILTFYITMIHETVHFGYYINDPNHDGTDKISHDEVGDRFISNNFGFNPSDAIKIMNLPTPINNTYTPQNEFKIMESNNIKLNKTARCSVTEGSLNSNKIETKSNGDRTLNLSKREGSDVYISRNLPTVLNKK